MTPATFSADFHEIETLAAAQRDFHAAHAQLSAGRFRFRMRLADLGPARLQANAVDGTYLVHARVRPGTWALFFPTGGPEGVSRLNGMQQGRHDAVLYGPGAELQGRVADGQRWTMATLEDTRFRDLLDRVPAAGEGRAVPLPRLLARAPGLLRLPELAATDLRGEAVAGAVVDGLREVLDTALDKGVERGGRLRAERRAVQVTNAAIAFLESTRGRAVSSTEIAAAAGVSVRFINLCFDAVYGTSLHRTLRAWRLAEARRRLLAGGAGLLVKQVALDLGFWHFGRFARAYQALYGETPSETLGAAGAGLSGSAPPRRR